jgi:oligopeptide transport system substrate-binding protein
MAKLLLIPLAFVVLLAGSLMFSGDATAPRAGLTFINRGEIGTLDPNRMAWMQDIRVGYCLFEGLYTLDPKTLESVPGAASGHDLTTTHSATLWLPWFGSTRFELTILGPDTARPDPSVPVPAWRSVSPVLTVHDAIPVYVFHIRPEAKWSNGDDVTTADFVFAWRRMLEEPGDYTYLLHYIAGAKEYQKAYAAKASPSFDSVGIKVLGPKTVQITLKHPVGFFLDIVSFPCMFPLNQKSMEPFIDEDVRKNSGKIVYKKDFTRPPHFVTNGTYRMASWEFKRRIRLEKNEHYWNRNNVRPPSIEVVSSDDFLWALTMYDTGGVDWLTEMSGELAAELIEKKRDDIHVFPSFGTYFYTFNCQDKLPDGRKNPFADVRVRQALSMAVKKEEIVTTVTRLGEPVTSQYIPAYSFKGYPAPQGQVYDLARARQLLADAGYPEGQGFPSISLLYNNEGQHAPIAQIVARQWKRDLGIDLRLEGVEIKTFRQRLHNKEYAVARASWYGDYNDLSTFTDKYKSESENNDSGWISKPYDDLCDQADREADPQRRMQLFAQAEKILLDECPILPMYHYMNVYMYDKKKISNLPHNSRNHVMMWPLDVQR